LNIGNDVVQPYFNVDTTSKLQHWKLVAISTLNLRNIHIVITQLIYQMIRMNFMRKS